MRAKRPTYSISIPEPCHEDWSKMTPTEKGRHCASCQKEVIDFTNKNNEQLFKIIDKGSNMCGRFRKEQLDTPLQLNRKDKNNLASLAASAALPIALLLSNETAAQDNSPKTKQVVQTSKTYTSLGIGMQHRELKEKTEFTITGIITDESGLPLPGTNVIIKGTQTGTQTDFDGLYNITVEKGQTLQFSYVGFYSAEKLITGDSNTINTTLVQDHSLDEVIIAAGFPVLTYYDKLLRKERKEAQALKREKIKNGKLDRTSLGKALYSIKSLFVKQKDKGNN